MCKHNRNACIYVCHIQAFRPDLSSFRQAWVRENYTYLVLEAMRLGSLFDVIYVKDNPNSTCRRAVARWRAMSPGRKGRWQMDSEDEKATLAVVFQILWGLR